MYKYRYSAAEKLMIIKKCEEGYHTVREVAALFELSVTTLREWMRVYHHGGIESLETRERWAKYSKELKIQAVRDVLEGRESLTSATLKFNISSRSVLRSWIANYNSHREKKTFLKENSSMTKGRSTTFEERVAAVLDCIQSGKDYQTVAQTHRVSYQQLYGWVRKYESDGVDALIDRRGRKKTEEELTEIERSVIEQKRLEKENELLRMELSFLKKLEEIERRRR